MAAASKFPLGGSFPRPGGPPFTLTRRWRRFHAPAPPLAQL